MSKIKWKVSEAPTGPYRSFFKRMWPSGDINGEMAFNITCDDSYVPANVRDGKHAELRLHVADRREKTVGWTWRVFKKRFTTLQEAKGFAQNFADRNPEVFVNRHDI